MSTDIFLRAHTVPPAKRKHHSKRERTSVVRRWPKTVLVFDTETTTDTSQSLTFGAFRRCELVGDEYRCVEEGLFHADDAPPDDRRILTDYASCEHAEPGIKAFPPKLTLALLSRSAFVEKCFWKCVQSGGMIVGFNLPFDLSRLAVEWHPSRNRG